MFKSILEFLLIDDVPLLLSWTFALYMIIGATVEISYKDIKTGFLFLVAFFFSYITIGNAIYSTIQLQENFKSFSLLLPTIILSISVAGVLSGKWLDKVYLKTRHLRKH